MRRWLAMSCFVCLVLPAAAAHAATPADIASLRSAIQDISATFPNDYPHADAYLVRLAEIEKDGRGDEQFRALQREALLANPLLSAQPILFVVRRQYAGDHHNTATFFPAAEYEYNDGHFQGGGAMKLLDVRTGRVTPLLDLPQGVARDPEVSFDGRRILFSMRKDPKDSYHLYEISATGGEPRALTRMKDVDDLDPIYLPDGGIIFTSTREPKYCACNRHIMANLFRMNGDGSNICQIGRSTLFEGHSSLMPDGRILYDRWEYVDRNFGDAQGLWTCNPDGTNHAVYWGNNTPSPGAVLEGRAIAGTDMVVCTFSSCHDRPWGAIAIVDPRRGLDGRDPVVKIWPDDARKLVKDPGTAHDAWDAFTAVKLKYEDPYPLADATTAAGAGKYFLCSRMTGEGERTAIYLIDVFGNEVMVHAEGPGCFDPMPLAPRARPGSVPERRDFENHEGYFYVQDVYQGTHMAGVERGSVKYLRVIESPEKKFWTRPGWNGQGFEGPAMNWHDFGNKTILGTVPVEADGSASFVLPSEKFVFFQLLDANGMMVQSMRSGTVVQSGERASCIGCHEDRRVAPSVPAQGVPMALRREPSRLEGWQGHTRPLSYLRDVQPVWDSHCVQCHSAGQEPKAKIDLSRGRGLTFNLSYTELWTKGQLTVPGAGPSQTLPAKSWGSHPSKLIKVLRQGHYDVKLSPAEMERVITWVDMNAPYYPSYASAYPDNLYGRSPLNDKQLAQLSQLTGQKMQSPTVVNFDQPELSPCLSKLPDKTEAKYREAMAIIDAGREALRQNPGPDCEDFVPCPVDQWRTVKYEQRKMVEMQNRQAVREGTRVYDRVSP
ncbi:MAG: hypothetical protein ACHRHE_06505 [Tepidisphaerales bacterium]